MPVGEYTKEEIRDIAWKQGLPVANKPDSQEICFVPDQDYARFIEENTDAKIPEGNFVDVNGKILGRHRGITHYTIGQRRGLNLPMGKRCFVVEIRPDTNEVVIGDNQDVFTDRLICDHLNFMSVPDIRQPMEVQAKIRYNHSGSPCTLRRVGEDEILCEFHEPVRAATPGQAVVFYDGDYVAGGGTIRSGC
jgi:tRNA-specific 2-thiouridylase